MKNKRLRLLAIVLASVAALLVLVALALPLLIDVNSYRGLIEEKAEEVLGRDVRMGEMSLSILPLGVKVADVAVAALPEEGDGDLIAARSLRVGARLGALLRKRLEVTSVNLVNPTVTLERGSDGAWNVERLIPPSERAEEPARESAGAPPISVDRARITGGTIVIRDFLGDAAGREVTVGDLEVTATDLALDRAVALTLSATVAGAKLALQGSAGPLVRPDGAPLEAEGSLKVDGLGSGELASLAATAGAAIPAGLLNEGKLGLDVSASYSGAAGSDPARLSVQGLVVRGLDATLRRNADGRWNFEEVAPAGGDRAREPADDGMRLTVSGLGLSGARLRYVDDASGTDIALQGLDLTLDRLPTEGSSEVEISADLVVGGARAAGLGVRGSLGPLSDGGTMPADLLLEIEEGSLASLGSYLQEELDVALTSGMLDLSVKVTGTLLEEFQASGTLDVAGAAARLAAPDGGERSVQLDVDVFYDVAIAGAGERVEFRTLDLNVDGNELSLSGTVDRSGARTKVDVALAPTRLLADDLAGLLALAAYDPGVAFSSDEPIEIEGRVRGEIGGEAYPRVNGKLVLRDFSFRHPTMEQPLEEVSGTVTLGGDSLDVTGFQARVGESDVAGELSLKGFQKPRIRFDMRSERADFWELMSFMSGPDEEARKAGRRKAGSEEDDFLSDVLAEGKLRIGAGSFRTLDFTDLDAGMRLEGQVVTLDPFRMSLYQGTFQGSATLDLREDPPAFQVKSDLRDLDVNAALVDNLDAIDMVSGKLRANLQASGAGTDFESIVRSLSGGGSVLMTEGQLQAVDVLDILADVTGVFGEQTLQSLSSRLAQEGTPFDRLSATLRLGGNGMRSDDLLLESPDIVVKGKARLDLLASTLDGDLAVIFSPQLSGSMRAEGSRAAKAFWDPRLDQVLLPLTVSGPYASPKPNVDWGTAAENVARRELEKEVGKRLGGLGGLVSGGDAGKGSTSLAPSPEQGQEGEASGATGDLVAEITRVRWGGSFLMKDLKVDGVVRGSGISHASLVVADASGREVFRRDRLDEVENYFRSGVDRASRAAISWDSTIDGKDLVRAEAPFTVILTLFHVDGGRVEARTRADR